MTKTLLLVAALLVPMSASAQTFLPPNTMRIPIGSLQDKGIDQAQFDAVLDQVQKVYGPIIAAKGGTLQINRLWEDDTVNASAQRSGSTYIINMYGGLARHEAVTQDGFALVACHELGHHIGGAPKIGGNASYWATNEGGADYFGNAKCLRRLYAAPGTARFTRMQGEDETAKAACEAAFKSQVDKAACLRGTMAGLSLATLLAGGGSAPSLSTPDTSVVSRTNDRHPAAQCRLDTYFQAALCARSYKEEVSDTNATTGTCTKSQGFTSGLRPRCWYKPAAGQEGPTVTQKVETLIRPDVFSGL